MSQQPVTAGIRLCSGWGSLGGVRISALCKKNIKLMPDHALGVLTDVNHFKVPE